MRKNKPICILIVFTILISALTACKPTPQKPAVVSKDGRLIEKIKATEGVLAPSNEPTATPEPDPESLTAFTIEHKKVDHVKFEKELASGFTTIKVDADVWMPDVTSYPVYKYRDKVFSQSDVDRIIQYLLGDKPLYNCDIPWTKAQIEARIVDTNFEYKDLDSEMAQIKGITDLKELHRQRDNVLEWLYKKLETASESLELTEIPTTMNEYLLGKFQFNDKRLAELRIQQTKDCYNGIEMRLLEENNEYNALDINNLISGDGRTYNYEFLDVDKRPDCLHMTPEEAIQKAKELFSVLGAGDDIGVYSIQVVRTREDLVCYVMQLKRYLDNIPIERVSSNNRGLDNPYEDWDDDIVPSLPHERMQVYLNDEGILTFRWENPLVLVGQENQNVELEVLNTVINNYKQCCINAYSYQYYGEKLLKHIKDTGYKTSFDVCDIRLDYGLARYPNTIDTYIAIPLWNFFGKYKEFSNDSEDQKRLDKEEKWIKENRKIFEFGYPGIRLQLEKNVHTTITINGIDGSRYNSRLGY